MGNTEQITVAVESGNAATPSSSTALEVTAGTRIGRYIVLETLGGGGMGVVLSAHDPDLERSVAIKLVRPSARRSSSTARARLLREAQAMAALSHPNVITVHDVGTFGEHVFVAMEQVDGRTLRQWMDAGPHPIESIVSVFAAAARGLDAAHQAGVVHRDFKPDNVMLETLGDDDVAMPRRVLVLDFGLARLEEQESLSSSDASWAAATAWPSRSGSVAGSGSAALTASGSVMGTPAYMSPEQHAGFAGPAADQFAFCTTLYEAIYGSRPFTGGDVRTLAKAKKRGLTHPLPPRPVVPRAVQRVLRRGLSPDPDDRYSTMGALVDALCRQPTRTRRASRWALGVAAVAGTGVVVGLGSRDVDVCERAGEDVHRMWNDARAQEVAARFEASQLPYADSTWGVVRDELDAYAEGLAQQRRAVCEAIAVDERNSGRALDRQVACLDRATSELAAWVDVLRTADAGVIEHAAQASASLPALQQCQTVPDATPPQAPNEADRPLLNALARARAIFRGGRYAAAQAELDAMRRDIEASGDHRLRAEAHLLRANVAFRLGRHEDAAGAALAAIDAAVAGRHERLEAAAWVELAFDTANIAGQLERSTAYLRSAEAAVARVGSPADLQAELLRTQAYVLREQGHYDQARKRLEESLVLEVDDEAGRIVSLAHLGRVMVEQGSFDEAETTLRRVVDDTEAYFGATHPNVARALTYLGEVLWQKGRAQDALPVYLRALQTQTELLGPRGLEVGYNHVNVAGIQVALGENEAALRSYETGRSIVVEHLGADHAQAGRISYNLAELWKLTGDMERAVAEYEQALDVLVAALGGEHPHVGQARNNLAAVLYDMQRFDEAVQEYRRALQILEPVLGPEHVDLAYPLVGIAQSELGRGQPEAALPASERAFALRTAHTVDPMDLADAQFFLAQALWDSGGDRDRAKELASQALVGYAKAPPGIPTAQEDARRWLARRAKEPSAER